MGNFKMLPGDIVLNILKRLPTESVLDCKLVSKTWNKVISHKSYSQSHLNHLLNNLDPAGSSGGKFTFLTVNDNPIYAYRLFHYIEFYDKNFSSEEQPFHRVARMKLNPAPFKFYNFCGSSNGLVCLNGVLDNEWVNYEPLYICNPITREFVFLPEFERTYDRHERLVTGFGYVSKTNEYKVVRMYNLRKEPNSVHVEVYTLGSGKGWRNIGKKFNKELKMFTSIRGLLLNGSLYYELSDGNIPVFDLASETFSELPEGFPISWTLGVLGGYLSATYYDKESKTFKVLLLKENKKKNNNKKKKEDGPSLTWIKEFSLSNMDTFEYLVLTGRGTVLCRSETEVQMYDLNSSSSKLLVDFGKDKGIFEAIPHMHTLVSLKALGEENTKTMETTDVPLPEDVKFDNPWEEMFYQRRVQDGDDEYYQCVRAAPCRLQ
ncbi:F-box protein At3g07870-like [Papaver somniferum]|uniref:F-box protein At3g07870-like n=1 Tax=Papaver somniferum TaxID=3469 RepID=UPI000E702910|nr:F-box protein At3g07870-like [Papaver somniferum]